MKIVVLDGYTLNPGDLSWEGLIELGDTIIYDHTPAELILERASGAEIVLTNKTPLTKEIIDALPDMKYIGVLATGYNVVDVAEAKEKGIVVCNIPAYGTASVSQMAFALLLELCQHVQNHCNAVKEGVWSNNRDFCFWNYPLVELAGKTMGIIGFGRIGQQTAKIADAFGMHVIYNSHTKRENGFQYVELDELFATSDVISLHCPLFPSTQGIINQDSLKKMKSSAFLINTSRGPLIVEKDLADALNNGIIAGAALDVLSVEPPTADNPLLTARNCLITPHISWATKEARVRLMDIAIDNVRAWKIGNAMNVVNR